MSTHFICNVCARENLAETADRETPGCAHCGSSVRIRSMLQMLSVELFGDGLPLMEFPAVPAVKALGLSDDWRYAGILARKFSYVNTYFDREPFLDIVQPHPDLYGTYDFVVSSEVFEHVPAPVERALEECHRLLKPHGFLCATVPFASDGQTREHYPELHEYATVNLGGRPVLVNRRRDGTIEIHEALVFHGGMGATLEMREFSQTGLVDKLRQAGFAEVIFGSEAVPLYGIFPEGNFSLPFIARKEHGKPGLAGDKIARPTGYGDGDLVRRLQIGELRSKVADLENKLRGVAESRWMRLGRRFGVGPKLR